MPEDSSTYLVGPPPQPKRKVSVLNIGAHRGARLNIPAFTEFNNSSVAAELVPTYADPLPGRAVALQREAAQQGVISTALERRGEDIVTSADAQSADPVVLNVDRASAIASLLRGTQTARRAVLGYLLLKLPSGKLLGLRFVLEPQNTSAREAAVAFFDELASASERSSSDAIFGEGGDPAHSLQEPLIRRWFSDHTKANLGKLVAALEPVHASFEITPDGAETLPLILSLGTSWSEPTALAEQVLANPTSPIRRGIRFIVAEVVPGEGVRFHTVRRRTDLVMTVDNAEVVDRSAFVVARAREMEAAREAELTRQAREALVRAEREMLSRTNPIWTTD